MAATQADCCLFHQISNSLKESLNHEVVHYDYRSSFFDIFVSVSVLTNQQLCDFKQKISSSLHSQNVLMYF